MDFVHPSFRQLCCAALVAAMTAGAHGVAPGAIPDLVGSSKCACAPGDLNGDCIIDGADLGVLLGAWGLSTLSEPSADLNGDGVVDGADLGAMLSGWGPCPPTSTCNGYASMSLVGEFVGGAGADLPLVVLSGQVEVFPSGEPQGSVTALCGDGSSVTIVIALTTTTVYVDSSVVALPSGGPPSLATIDGVVVAVPAMLAQFDSDMRADSSPMDWSVAGRAVLALAALSETGAFCCDMKTALQDATSASSAFWCKIGIVSLGGHIMAEAIPGCDNLTSGCGEAKHAMIGGFSAPCYMLEALCADGVFAGPQAAFDAVLGMWLGK